MPHSTFRWWLIILIVLIVIIPVVFLILFLCRRSKSVADAAEAKKRMRISAAVEDVDWGLDENDQKNPGGKAKSNNDLIIPFDHIPPE